MITQEELQEILRKHKLWLNNKVDGEKAELFYIDLSNVNLSNIDLSYVDLLEANLSNAKLRGANLTGANLRFADLRGADLRGAYLSFANLIGSNLSFANLRCANLRGTKLSYANLSRADLRGADLKDADLIYANLRKLDLKDSNLSGCKGLINPIDFMNNNFEKTKDGYIAYKCFNGEFKSPDYWIIKENSIISEVCNSNRTDNCGCGINVATLKWVQDNYNNEPIWKVLIEWEWLLGVIIPYDTNGKIRCSKVKLLEIIN